MTTAELITIANLREDIRIGKRDELLSIYWKKQLPKLELKLANLLINQ